MLLRPRLLLLRACEPRSYLSTDPEPSRTLRPVRPAPRSYPRPYRDPLPGSVPVDRLVDTGWSPAGVPLVRRAVRSLCRACARSLCRVLDYVGIDYHLRDFADIQAARGF